MAAALLKFLSPKRTLQPRVAVASSLSKFRTRRCFATASEAVATSTTTDAQDGPNEQAAGKEDEDDGYEGFKIRYKFTPPPPLSDESKAKIERLCEKIVWLDMIELSILTHIVTERIGTGAAVLIGGDISQAAAGSKGAKEEAPAVEQKSLFDVKLVGFDAKAKIKVIKEVRAVAGLGLKEAKELVESVPKVVQKDLKPDKAEELKAQLEAIGAQVEIV